MKVAVSAAVSAEMTDEELQLWVALLGRTQRQRIAVIVDLLLHANLDRMSQPDRQVCFRALRWLGTSFREQRMLSTTSPRSVPPRPAA